MPVESEADRASFFDADEFAQFATLLGTNIPGFFDESTTLLGDLANAPVQSTDPTFLCQLSRIPEEAGEGTPIKITRDDGTIFAGIIVTIEPDGFGMALISLRENG